VPELPLFGLIQAPTETNRWRLTPGCSLPRLGHRLQRTGAPDKVATLSRAVEVQRGASGGFGIFDADRSISDPQLPSANVSRRPRPSRNPPPRGGLVQREGGDSR
jgi:hypothetical protein